jgi:hypothetical protein
MNGRKQASVHTLRIGVRATKRGQAMHRALVICSILAVASPAVAGPFAYATTDDGDFGVLDLGSGAYEHCGFTGTLLFGLAVGPHGALYGMDTGNLYRLNPHNGARKFIASAGNYRVAFGSAANTLYAVDSFANLYTVDPKSGAQAAAGAAAPAGVFVDVLSTGAQTLFEATSSGLYDYAPKQRIAHRKNRDHSVVWGGLALVADVLYGVGMASGQGETTQYVYSISTVDGSTTVVATLSSAFTGITGLAPTPPDNTGACTPQR